MGLVLLGALILTLSKDATFFRSTYQLRLVSDNVGDIQPGAKVLLSGVAVGTVSHLELQDDGKQVTVFLNILDKVKIYRDAEFAIEQFGLLGDQYVAIYPQENAGELLKSNDAVQTRAPFNLQETAGIATDTLARIGAVATNLQQAVTDVRRYVLTEETLRNLGGSVERFGALSSEALFAVSNVNSLVVSNAMPLTLAVSNLNWFASELIPLADRATGLIASNEQEIAATVQNLHVASSQLTNLMARLQTEQGVVWRLLNDEQLAADFSNIASNLSVTTSNLNRKGLWGILWKQKR
jgi:phospholipid/cholesterol/gamma-HCH transport system substrate-binding protein